MTLMRFHTSLLKLASSFPAKSRGFCKDKREILFSEWDGDDLNRAVFSLNSEGQILDYASDAPYFDITLDGSVSLENLLAVESLVAWNSHVRFFSEVDSKQWIPLSFRMKSNLIVPTACRMFQSTKASMMLYSVFDLGFLQTQPKMETLASLLPERLKTYIEEHLDLPLPKLKVLARQFGTNEHTLNDVFRDAFGIPIYTYYTSRRLENAMVLIKESSLPLKNISLLCGYSTYSVFSKAFRRRFGVSASMIAR